MTADRSTPDPGLLRGARAASSRPGAYAASSRLRRDTAEAATRVAVPPFVLTVAAGSPDVAGPVGRAKGGAVAASARAAAQPAA